MSIVVEGDHPLGRARHAGDDVSDARNKLARMPAMPGRVPIHTAPVDPGIVQGAVEPRVPFAIELSLQLHIMRRDLLDMRPERLHRSSLGEVREVVVAVVIAGHRVLSSSRPSRGCRSNREWCR